MAQGTARQTWLSWPPPSFAIPASGVGAQIGQPQGSGFGWVPPHAGNCRARDRGTGARTICPTSILRNTRVRHRAADGTAAGIGIRLSCAKTGYRRAHDEWAPTRSTRAADGSAYSHSTGTGRATCSGGRSAARGAARLAALRPAPIASTSPERRQTGLVGAGQSQQASDKKGCNVLGHLAHWILHMPSHTAIRVPSSSPRLLGRFPRNDVDFNAVQTQNSERHETPRSTECERLAGPTRGRCQRP
jgi:hypothetical protein